MGRLIPIRNDHAFFSSIPVAIALFASVSFLVALCAKRVRLPKKKIPISKKTHPNSIMRVSSASDSDSKFSLIINKMSGSDDEETGELGVWQKAILMGEKCEPPKFSGAIFYDCDGNQVPEMPKSPRPRPANFTGPSWSPTSDYSSGK